MGTYECCNKEGPRRSGNSWGAVSEDGWGEEVAEQVGAGDAVQDCEGQFCLSRWDGNPWEIVCDCLADCVE